MHFSSAFDCVSEGEGGGQTLIEMNRLLLLCAHPCKKDHKSAKIVFELTLIRRKHCPSGK